eukprot:7008997-Pyramimonas_sp.AAC.1
MEPSWRPIGRYFDDLLGPMGRRGPSEGRTQPHLKMLQKPATNQCFWYLFAFLKALLEALLGRPGPSQGHVRPSWWAPGPSDAVGS